MDPGGNLQQSDRPELRDGPRLVCISVRVGLCAVGCRQCQETAVLCLYIWLLASLQGKNSNNKGPAKCMDAYRAFWPNFAKP